MLATNPIAAKEEMGLVNDAPKQMSQLGFLVHPSHCQVTRLHDLAGGVQQSPFTPVTEGPLEIRLIGVLQWWCADDGFRDSGVGDSEMPSGR